ncbi:MAG: peptidoglycan-binding domain-containing protein, partial [Patescibacteria group bacterium]
MSTITKKIVAIAMALSVFALVAPAQGATVEELQAQINSLLATLATLQAQLSGTTQTGVTGCTITSFATDLSQGMTSADVKCLQIILNSDAATKVAATGAGSPGNETTYFGALTYAAVVKFQNKYASEVLTPIGLTAGTGYVGARTRAKLNTMFGTVVVPPVVPPVTNPLTVALASNSPVASNLQKSTANNVMVRITFTGSSAADTYVTGLAIKNYGNAENGIDLVEVNDIKLFDESNIQIGTTRNLIGGTANFVVIPAIVVPKNGTKTVSVTANVTANAETLTTVQLGLDSATAITGATFAGNYPVKGSVFTIVPSGAIGTLTTGDYSTPPVVSVKIGQTNVILESFIVGAGSREDVRINQITLENEGTISATDITNIRIREVGGSVV